MEKRYALIQIYKDIYTDEVGSITANCWEIVIANVTLALAKSSRDIKPNPYYYIIIEHY